MRKGETLSRDFLKPKETESLPQRVYFVRCPNDETVLVAIDVQIDEEHVRWFDTVKGRVMRFSQKELTDEGHFTFSRSEIDEGAGEYEYTFVPMNLDVYEQYVKDRLIQGKSFDSTEDVIASFIALLEDES